MAKVFQIGMTRGWLLLLWLGVCLPAAAQLPWAASGVKGRVFCQGTASPLPARPLRNGNSVLFANQIEVPEGSRLGMRSAINVFSAGTGRFIQRVSTDDAGRFQIILPPGAYRLQPADVVEGNLVLHEGAEQTAAPSYWAATEQFVRVQASRATQATFVYRKTLMQGVPAWPPICIPRRPVLPPLPGMPIPTPPPQTNVVVTPPSPPLSPPRIIPLTPIPVAPASK